MRRIRTTIVCVLCTLALVVSMTLVVLPRETAAYPSRDYVYRSPQTVFWDDFEVGLGKWITTTSGSGVITTSNAQSKIGYWGEQSSYSLYVDAPGSADMAYAKVYYPDYLYEDHTVIFDFMLPDANNHWFKVFEDQNVRLVMVGTQLIQYLGEGVTAGGYTTYQDIMTLVTDVWYRFELRVYPERLQFDVYVSGVFIKSGDFHMNRYVPPYRFYVGDPHIGANWGAGYWDNIHVAPLHTIPFEEDFGGPFGSADWTSVVTPGETLEISAGEVHIASTGSGVASFYVPFLDYGKHRHYVVTMDFRFTGNHHFFKVYSDPHVIIILNDDTLYSHTGSSTLQPIIDINENTDYSLEFRVSAQPQDEVTVETIVNGEYTGKVDGRLSPHHHGYAVFGDTKDSAIYGEAYWGSISIGPDKRDSTWAMCSHNEWRTDGCHPCREEGYAALEHVRKLNASYYRVDFSWELIEPQRDQWNLDWIKWYDNLLDQLEGMGLDVILVAPHWDGAPSWAESMWDGGNPGPFYNEYMEFTEKLAEEFGPKVYYYQLLNECNHFDHTPLWISAEQCAILFLNGHVGLLSGEGTGFLHHDDFKAIVNVFANLPWMSWIEDFMEEADDNDPYGVDVIAVDHYPGSWSIWPNRDSSNIDWSPLHTIESLALQYDKELAIMETGFPTPSNDESDQQDWLYYNLPVLQDEITQWNHDHPDNQYVLQAYYELVDEDSGTSDWEDNWGLMRDDWSKKPGYPEFGGRAMDFHRWSSVIKADRDAPGHETEGGGIAFAQINNDPAGRPDALFAIVDSGGSPGAENKYKYVVFWDIQPDGSFLDWDVFSPNKKVYGTQSEGGGVAIAQIDNDPAGRPDVVFMNVDIGSPENQISYRIGWNINTGGLIGSWSPKIALGDAGGDDTDGGGIALGDLDNNGNIDALVMVADASGDYRYKV
ncbi:MAG: family 1 glycosylhydrolase, partial [Thermoplasmata archaeon]